MNDPVQEIADACGGIVESREVLPDGSGAATVSFPLPKDHWLCRSGANVPPMPFKLGTDQFFVYAGSYKYFPPEQTSCTISGEMKLINRQQFADAIRAAGRYAIRASTMNGADDYDPDALLQNLVVGFLGYWTENGLDPEADFNPKKEYRFTPEI